MRTREEYYKADILKLRQLVHKLLNENRLLKEALSSITKESTLGKFSKEKDYGS